MGAEGAQHHHMPPALRNASSRPQGPGGLCSMCKAGRLRNLLSAAYSSTKACSQVSSRSETQESSR